MKVFFLGGLLDFDGGDYVAKNSSGVVQNAAHVFQYNLIKGLKEHFTEIIIINLPFVGSYPRRFKRVIVRGHGKTIFDVVPIVQVSFVNFSIIKYFSRHVSTFLSLLSSGIKNKDVIIIYSMHLPFLSAVVFVRFFTRKKFKIVMVVPDLPEYMDSKNRLLYTFAKYVERKIFDLFIKSVNGYVFLTKSMSSALNAYSDFVVVEGIATDINEYGCESIKDKGFGVKSAMYSGTLALRYGIEGLLKSFSSVEDPDVELWICGDGDGKCLVELYQNKDSRIKYLGQLARQEVILLQRKATVLVNPRTSEGEYTKYSFPSKVIEYMSSGTPVIMFKLPGIPDEYYDYCFTPASESIDGLADCFRNVFSMENNQLNKVGLKAQNFVCQEKSSYAQALKIKNLIEEIIDVCK